MRVMWLAGAVLASLSLPTWAEAAEAPAAAPTATIELGGRTGTLSGLQAAELLIQAGKIDDARKVLLAIEKAQADGAETQFLLGLIAVQQKRYDEAIRRFRRILVHEPAVARVRLELARAFFLKHDWDNAERQFRLARAARLPPAAIANVDQYLYAIRQSRRWTYNLSLAAAPDTNLNAGPAVGQIAIFGLPFQLSPQTRQHSGVGAALDLGGGWAAPIGNRWRLSAGAQFHGLVYPNHDFDDLSLAVYAGPEVLLRRWDIGVRGTAFRRWYGGREYNQGAGGSLSGVYYLSPRFGLNASAGGQAITFASLPQQSGVAASGSLGAFYTPNPSSVVRASLAVTRQSARTRAYAYTAEQLIVGYDRDLPGGISVSLEPSVAVSDYDAPLAAFSKARRDRQWSVQVALLDRGIDVAGFTPRLLYAFTRNDSDIPLYAFDRNHFEIGVTRVF